VVIERCRSLDLLAASVDVPVQTRSGRGTTRSGLGGGPARWGLWCRGARFGCLLARRAVSSEDPWGWAGGCQCRRSRKERVHPSGAVGLDDRFARQTRLRFPRRVALTGRAVPPVRLRHHWLRAYADDCLPLASPG
jgi:hypothetical protein